VFHPSRRRFAPPQDEVHKRSVDLVGLMESSVLEGAHVALKRRERETQIPCLSGKYQGISKNSDHRIALRNTPPHCSPKYVERVRQSPMPGAQPHQPPAEWAYINRTINCRQGSSDGRDVGAKRGGGVLGRRPYLRASPFRRKTPSAPRRRNG
jgi:hypothetical protein